MKELLERQRELTARMNVYRDEYYNKNAPSVSDTVYDRLFDELLELEEQTGVVMTNSPTQTVGYPVVSGLPEMNPIKVHPKKFYSTFCGSRMFLFSASPFSRNL